MPIGKLDKRVTFQHPQTSRSGTGQTSVAWSNIPSVPTVWAEVVSTGGSENQEGQVLQPQHAWEIRIRPRSDLTAGMRVIYGSKVLYITSVGDPSKREGRQVLLASESIPTS